MSAAAGLTWRAYSENLAFAGAAGEASIAGVWTSIVPTKSTSWGRVKAVYR